MTKAVGIKSRGRWFETNIGHAGICVQPAPTQGELTGRSRLVTDRDSSTDNDATLGMGVSPGL